MTLDPNELANSAWNSVGASGNATTPDFVYGPSYDPDELLQRGIDPTLISAYRRASAAYNQAMAAAGNAGYGTPNTALKAAITQAASSLRALESNITGYFKAPKEAAPSSVPINTTAPYLLTRDDQGVVQRELNPNYIPPKDQQGTEWADKYGNRWSQDPAQTYPGSYEPAQRPPAQMTWQDPNAGLKRAEDEARLEQIRASTAASNRSGLPTPQYPSVITYGNAAYKVDPYTGAVEKVHDFPQPEPTPVDLWKLQNDRETQRIADEQAMARQRMQTQASLTNTLGDQWLRASQWAMPPEWGGVPPGFGADGPYGQLLRMGGSNPQSVQLPQMNFDPLNAWRMAQDAMGG